ncbi:mechanosensitive ion channel family protein [Algoriphagus machipongonensis]|uniref:Transporter, small conductance mechanosensitive ion channel (MscS) family n=1 Tax=Algoriphagus machipongonensis TaxID=388413 RepID=A3I249_9BACT|nr:mechanosensitive ion channel domain-containing protein [Algoriphagus machipongonensis]EAZ79453.1 transporter, small conductance mechanosensitive ion channel (MscS) family [Algoriphagus machipongonensis]
MNHLKSSIQTKENAKRRNFVFKLILLLLLEYVFVGNTMLSPILEKYPVLNNLLSATIFLLSSNLIISLGRFAALRFYLNKTKEERVQPNFVIGINRISWILNVLIFLISLMLAFGIKPLEFLTSITIVAAAIALLTKDYITNIANGLIIMFSDQLEIGDKIQISKTTGFIRDITLINLVLKSETGETVIVPNSMVLSSEITNYSRNNSHQMIFDFELNNSLQTPLDELEKSLTKELEPFSNLVFLKGSQLTVLDRKAEHNLLRFQFPIKTGEKVTEKEIRKLINQAILNLNHAKGEA